MNNKRKMKKKTAKEGKKKNKNKVLSNHHSTFCSMNLTTLGAP
jgi:hypothetical protein